MPAQSPAQPRRIEYVPLAQITPADRNPREHRSLQTVKASIRRYGFVEAGVHDGRTDKIIAGHGRGEALEEMKAAGEEPPEGITVGSDGEWLVPLQYGWSSRNDAEAEALLVNLNRLVETGGWEKGGLSQLLEELRETAPADFALTGWESSELDEMIAELAQVEFEALEDPADLDDVGPAPTRAAAVSRLGDVWILGRHRLAVGVCTDAAVVQEALGPGGRAQLVFTDPPYAVDYESGAGKVMNDDLSVAELGKQILRPAFKVIREFLIPGGCFYICTSDIAEGEFRNALADSGLRLRQQVVWVKDSFVLGRKDHHYQHEAMLYGDAAEAPTPEPLHFEPQHENLLYGWRDGAGHEWSGDRKQTTTWLFPKPRSSDLHPTMKPVQLVRRAVINSSKPGVERGRVLDPFGGSGSTLIACELSNRSASLVELDLPYADVICRRFEEHTGGVTPVRENDGAQVSFRK